MRDLLLLIAALLLVGCGASLEKESRERVADIFKDLEVRSVDTEYASDSICILTLVINDENEWGGKTLSRFEYICRQYDDVRKEALRPINGEMTMLEQAKNGLAGYNEEGFEPDLRFRVGIYLMSNGREVTDAD